VRAHDSDKLTVAQEEITTLNNQLAAAENRNGEWEAKVRPT